MLIDADLNDEIGKKIDKNMVYGGLQEMKKAKRGGGAERMTGEEHGREEEEGREHSKLTSQLCHWFGRFGRSF